MIEVDSGDYFVDTTPLAALHRAQAVHPNKAFCLICIGDKAVRNLKLETFRRWTWDTLLG